MKLKKHHPKFVLKTLVLSLALSSFGSAFASDPHHQYEERNRLWHQTPEIRANARTAIDEYYTQQQHGSLSDLNKINTVRTTLVKNQELLRSEVKRQEQQSSPEMQAWLVGMQEWIREGDNLLSETEKILNQNPSSSQQSTQCHSPSCPISGINAQDASANIQAPYIDLINTVSTNSPQKESTEPRLTFETWFKNFKKIPSQIADRQKSNFDQYQADAIKIDAEQQQRELKKQQHLEEKWAEKEREIKDTKRYLELRKQWIEDEENYIFQTNHSEYAQQPGYQKQLISRKEVLDYAKETYAKSKKDAEIWLSKNEAELEKEKSISYKKQAERKARENDDQKYQPFLSEILARRANHWLHQINQPYANELLGYDGKNVVIGIIDHGFQTNRPHPQFTGKSIKTFNAYNPQAHVDRHDEAHGTRVASIAAGKLAILPPSEFDDDRDLRRRKHNVHPDYEQTEGNNFFQGVAPGAQLAFVDVSGGSSSWRIAESIRWLVDEAKASIINFSASTRADWHGETEEALKYAISKDVLFVASAGNEDFYQLLWPGTYANQPWADDKLLIVGAVDENGKISPFSNIPGKELAPWFVVAPGQNIITGDNGSSREKVDGTSFAAPMVAGLAALIADRWPYLSKKDISKIIRKTATHLGESKPGEPDEVYGCGQVNARAAILPTGTLKIIDDTGKKIPIQQASIKNFTGTLAAPLLLAAQQGHFKIGCALDDFNRCYPVDLGKFAQPTPLLSEVNADEIEVDSQKTFFDKQGSYISYTLHSLRPTVSRTGILGHHIGQDSSVFSRVSIVKRFDNGTEFSAGIGGMNHYMGLSSYQIEGAPTLATATFNEAYSNLVPVASGIALGRQFASGTKIKLGLSTSHFSRQLLGQQHPNFIAKNPINNDDDLASRLTSLEVSQHFGNSIMGISFSMLGEKNALLGTQSFNQAYRLDNQANTHVLTFNMAHKLAEGVALAGYFSQGITKAYDNSASSLIRHVSAIRSQAYGLGLVLGNRWKQHDQLTLSFSTALAPVSGIMTTNALSTITADNQYIYKQQHINLSSPAQEYRAEIAYFMPVKKDSSLTFKMAYRNNVGNLPGRKEQLAIISYRIQH